MKTNMHFTSVLCVAFASLLLLSGQYDRQTASAQQSPSKDRISDSPITPTKGSSDSTTKAKQGERDQAPDQAKFADDHAPALGVLIGACPGPGVCVMQTLEDSPADSVGIEPGDYILAINDREVSSPQEVKKIIAGLESSDTVNVSIWRRGQKLTKQVALAAEAKELPGSHRSWLGVMLSDGSESEAVVNIDEVLRNSPADRAGLRSGDDIVKVNGHEIKSIEHFVELVQDQEPGAELKLTVRRGEENMETPVVLGEIVDAPMQWFRQSFRTPNDDDDLSQPRSLDADLFDEMLDDMRQQIRSLQQQVDELKSSNPAAKKQRGGADKARAGQPAEDDVSAAEASSSEATTLVQYSGRRGIRTDRSRAGSRSRYGYRGNRYGSDRYRSYSPYRGYRSSPYRYYNHGGRSHYYGGRYPYGFRGGVQIGPNLGIYW